MERLGGADTPVLVRVCRRRAERFHPVLPEHRRPLFRAAFRGRDDRAALAPQRFRRRTARARRDDHQLPGRLEGVEPVRQVHVRGVRPRDVEPVSLAVVAPVTQQDQRRRVGGFRNARETLERRLHGSGRGGGTCQQRHLRAACPHPFRGRLRLLRERLRVARLAAQSGHHQRTGRSPRRDEGRKQHRTHHDPGTAPDGLAPVHTLPHQRRSDHSTHFRSTIRR